MAISMTSIAPRATSSRAVFTKRCHRPGGEPVQAYQSVVGRAEVSAGGRTTQAEVKHMNEKRIKYKVFALGTGFAGTGFTGDALKRAASDAPIAL